MRYKLYFTLENEKFPIDYRRSVLSWIKHSLLEYDEKYYKKLYNEKDPIVKDFTFALFLNDAEFSKEEIIIKSKRFEINMSIENINLAMIFYNSFNHQRNKKFSINKNSFILENISMTIEKTIKTEDVIIKFLSPLCVRNRQDKKDYYYSFNDTKFLETLKINIREQLKITDIPIEVVDEFNIEAIKPKKTVVKFYEKQIECSLGMYKISGNKELLNYLYKAGMGSKHSAGFGMFQVI